MPGTFMQHSLARWASFRDEAEALSGLCACLESQLTHGESPDSILHLSDLHYLQMVTSLVGA